MRGTAGLIYVAWWAAQEDPWNAILSGAATGGLLAIRGENRRLDGYGTHQFISCAHMPHTHSCSFSAGPKAAAKNALIGGVILAMIEGASIALTKVSRLPHQNAAMKLLGRRLTCVCLGRRGVVAVLRSAGVDDGRPWASQW